jgi:hypothetical protein
MGDFDFDADDEPEEKGKDRKERSGGSARRGGRYSAASRRMPGKASLSIGGFVMLAGGLIGLIAMLLPAGGMFGQNVGVNEVVGARVWLWSIGALAVGGGFLRVRTVRFPSAGDYLLVGLGVLLALVFGVFQALSGYAIIDRLGLKGAGTYGLLLAGALTIFGGVLRCVEQVRRYGREDEEDDARPRRRRPAEDEDEDEEPRPRRRPERDEDEDEEPRPRRRRPERDEDDEDEEPKPKPKAKRKPPDDE